MTTPSEAPLVDPLPQGPALSNQAQVDSPSATPSLLMPIAAVNAKYDEMSSEEICRQELKTAQEVLQKYPDLHIESKIGVLAVKLARQAFLVIILMKRCIPRGWQNMPEKMYTQRLAEHACTTPSRAKYSQSPYLINPPSHAITSGITLFKCPIYFWHFSAVTITQNALTPEISSSFGC